VYKKRVLKYKFESDRKGMTGKWTKLDSEQLRDLYSSPNIICVIKARWMRWAVYMPITHTSFGGENEGKKPLRRQEAD
jgi:hypothetical protein